MALIQACLFMTYSMCQSSQESIVVHLGQVAEDALAGEEGRLGRVKPMGGQRLRNWRRRQVSAHVHWTWKLQPITCVSTCENVQPWPLHISVECCPENDPGDITFRSAAAASKPPAKENQPLALIKIRDSIEHRNKHLLLVWDDCIHQVNLLLRHLGQVQLIKLQTQVCL